MAPNRHNQTLVVETLFFYPGRAIPGLRPSLNHSQHAGCALANLSRSAAKPHPNERGKTKTSVPNSAFGSLSRHLPTSVVKTSSQKFFVQNAQKPCQLVSNI